MLNTKKNTKVNKRLDKLVVYLLISGSILMGCAVSFYFIGHYMVDKNLHNVNSKIKNLVMTFISKKFILNLRI